MKEVYHFYVWLRDLIYNSGFGRLVWRDGGKRTGGTEWTEDDLCALLYLMCKLEGKGAYPIRHLVIDEAQDMSALGFLAVKQLTAMDTFTVVGDVRQRSKAPPITA
ncbi:MAG: hypothetical protein ACLR23_05185 [Clostridia bacterium]